jgi:S-adenosylmethionine decarboxylase proenzyme
MKGLHLTADLFGCRDPAGLLGDGARLGVWCEQVTVNAGLHVVGRQFHAFAPAAGGPGGWTGVLLLAESHLAIHTWPERRAVTLDVFVCNVNDDNSAKARLLIEALVSRFDAETVIHQQLNRGELA